MRLGALLAAATLLALMATRARSADYPWCYIDQTMSGSTYCAFTTLAQCRENAGGNGGFCVPNPSWRGPSASDGRHGQRR
jgi:Protein of unknown function (DUF3551)